MIHLCFGRKTVFFIGIVAAFFIMLSEISAQEGMLTTFSGRVIDESGNPIPERGIAVVPVFDGNGAWFPLRAHNPPIEGTLPFHTESDTAGHFEISNIVEGPVLLSLFPSRGSDVRIIKVKIDGLFLYPAGRERGVVFATSPGRRIENIEVIIQQPHIRGSVQRTDGIPLSNADIRLRLRAVSLYGNSSGSYGGIRTDTEGYFTYYVERALGVPTFYILSVVHQGQTVNAKPIILKPGDKTHEVVFKFDNMPASPLRARRGGVAAGASASTSAPRPIVSASLEDVWIIRPENGHAYKRIGCADWEDGQTQAAAEGAYLVTINDAEEQKWLQAVLGGQPSWIGLNDIAEEGQWVWDNGEPVTYTNWGLQEPDDTNIGEEDYVILSPSGEWEDFSSGHGGISLIRTAIIEKENLPVKK